MRVALDDKFFPLNLKWISTQFDEVQRTTHLLASPSSALKALHNASLRREGSPLGNKMPFSSEADVVFESGDSRSNDGRDSLNDETRSKEKDLVIEAAGADRGSTLAAFGVAGLLLNIAPIGRLDFMKGRSVFSCNMDSLGEISGLDDAEEMPSTSLIGRLGFGEEVLELEGDEFWDISSSPAVGEELPDGSHELRRREGFGAVSVAL